MVQGRDNSKYRPLAYTTKCMYSSQDELPLNISFYEDGGDMELDRNGSKLILRYPLPSIVGTYRCVAFNLAGNKTGTIQVVLPTTFDLTSPAGQALKASIAVTATVVALLLLLVAYCFRRNQVN